MRLQLNSGFAPRKLRSVLILGSMVLFSPWAEAINIADMDITELVNVRISPFDVSNQLDRGYRASNSISASRLDTPIRDLPFAIQAFTSSFIEDQKARDIFDVARYSPGVTYRSNDFNEGNANLAIRGFAVSSTPGNVQILRDGFHGPSIFDMTNIARVEVLKGPASFLYGQVAPGGIVNVISKSPEAVFDATVDARYGSDNQYRFELDVTGPVNDALLYRLSASYDHDIEYWDPYNASSRDFAPSLRWQPDDRLSVSIKYEYFHKNEDPQVMQKPGYNPHSGLVPTASDPNLVGVDVPGLPANWNGLSFHDYRDSETRQLSTWVDFEANDQWNLRAGYSNLEYEVDALFSGNFGMANNTTLIQGRRVRFQIYSNSDETLELQAVGKYKFDHASLRLLLGAQYVDRRFDSRAGQAPNDPALGDDPSASPLPLWDLGDPATWDRSLTIARNLLTESAYDRSTDHMDVSLYSGVTLDLFDERLRLLAGGRMTSTESQLIDRSSIEVTPEISADAFTPQYGVLFKLKPDLSLFASWAKSFVPGAQFLFNSDDTRSPAEPTEGKGCDIGIKVELLDGRLSSTLSYFDIRNENIVNDLASTSTEGIVEIFNVQSGEQRSTGLELDATTALSEHWQLYLSYSYTDARITQFSGNDKTLLKRDIATLTAAEQTNYRNALRLHNAPLQMSAPHIANLWTRYDFHFSSSSDFYIAGGFNAIQDQTLLPDSPASSRQDYVLVNLMLGYSRLIGDNKIDISLVGKNLADEVYRPSQSTRSRPREFFLALSMSY